MSETETLPRPHNIQQRWRQTVSEGHEKLLCVNHKAPPPGRFSITGDMSPEPMVPLVGKDHQGWTSTPLASWVTPLWSRHTAITGGSSGLDHWESNSDGVGGSREGLNNQCSDLGRLSSYLHSHVGVPTSSLVHLQSQDGSSVWPRNLVGCLIWVLKWSPDGPGAWPAPAQAGELSHRLSSTAEYSSRPTWPESLVGNLEAV